MFGPSTISDILVGHVYPVIDWHLKSGSRSMYVYLGSIFTNLNIHVYSSLYCRPNIKVR